MVIRIFSLLSLSILIFSCSKHQYFSISSQLPQEYNGSFLFESDTIKVVYSFTQKGKVNIEITNKLNKLIYVDWQKSSMIFNSESIPFKDGRLAFDGSASTTNILSTIETTNIRGTVSTTLDRNYIPPNSKSSRLFSKMPKPYVDLKTVESFEEINQFPGASRKYVFSESESINSYQTYIYLNDTDESGAYIINHKFWVSEMVESLEGDKEMKPNQFKISKTTAAGVFFGTLGLVTVVLISIPVFSQ
jgi:hypothetical protein